MKYMVIAVLCNFLIKIQISCPIYIYVYGHEVHCEVVNITQYLFKGYQRTPTLKFDAIGDFHPSKYTPYDHYIRR